MTRLLVSVSESDNINEYRDGNAFLKMIMVSGLKLHLRLEQQVESFSVSSHQLIEMVSGCQGGLEAFLGPGKCPLACTTSLETQRQMC